MPVTVLSSASAEGKRLTSKEAFKAELRINGDADDDWIDGLIDQASAAIGRYCGRGFALETYSETVAGYGDTTLMLSRTPLVSVQSVVCDSQPITDYDLSRSDLDAGFLYRRVGWAWTYGRSVSAFEPGPGVEAAPAFTVVYTAGYVTAGENRTLPADLERACLDTVKAWWAARERDPAVVQEQVGASSWTRADAAGATLALPPVVVGLLRHWVRTA